MEALTSLWGDFCGTIYLVRLNFSIPCFIKNLLIQVNVIIQESPCILCTSLESHLVTCINISVCDYANLVVIRNSWFCRDYYISVLCLGKESDEKTVCKFYFTNISLYYFKWPPNVIVYLRNASTFIFELLDLISLFVILFNLISKNYKKS